MIFKEPLQAVVACQMECSNGKYGRPAAFDGAENLRKPLPVPVVDESTKGNWAEVELRLKLAFECSNISYTPGCVKPIESVNGTAWVRNDELQPGNLL